MERIETREEKQSNYYGSHLFYLTLLKVRPKFEELRLIYR